ncbi:MAG: hypothetical protein OEZ41_11490 [Nitrospirota bacterium]|nr:hypothetical protein [Nitrospirota bacterium]
MSIDNSYGFLGRSNGEHATGHSDDQALQQELTLEQPPATLTTPLLSGFALSLSDLFA